MSTKVTGDMIITDVLDIDQGTATVFLDYGLHCLGCPASSGDTIRDACEIHGIDFEELVEDLNSYLESVGK